MWGLTYYPQSNGKLERWHKTVEGDELRLHPPADVAEARRRVAAFVEHYNGVRLHGAIGDVTPNDVLAGRAPAIWAARDRKLEAAREARAQARARAREEVAAAQGLHSPPLLSSLSTAYVTLSRSR